MIATDILYINPPQKLNARNYVPRSSSRFDEIINTFMMQWDDGIRYCKMCHSVTTRDLKYMHTRGSTVTRLNFMGKSIISLIFTYDRRDKGQNNKKLHED